MSVGPVVRPLWRAADSGAEAPKLAARPFECVPRSLRCWIRWILGGYGVATISRLLKIIGLFCKRALWKRQILQKRPRILRSLLIVATPYPPPPQHMKTLNHTLLRICANLRKCANICTYVTCIAYLHLHLLLFISIFTLECRCGIFLYWHLNVDMEYLQVWPRHLYWYTPPQQHSTPCVFMHIGKYK